MGAVSTVLTWLQQANFAAQSWWPRAFGGFGRPMSRRSLEVSRPINP
jgi:hypothetical protein